MLIISQASLGYLTDRVHGNLPRPIKKKVQPLEGDEYSNTTQLQLLIELARSEMLEDELLDDDEVEFESGDIAAAHETGISILSPCNLL